VHHHLHPDEARLFDTDAAMRAGDTHHPGEARP
jgi:hypothetical protein